MKDKSNPWQSFIKNIFTVGFFLTINRVLGVLSDTLMALVLGCQKILDVYLIGFLIPSFFRKTFSEGAFSCSFIPIFTQLHADKGLDEAVRFSRRIYSILLLASLCLVCGMEAFSRPILAAVLGAKSEDADFFEKTLFIARMSFPFIGFCFLNAFFCSILNAINRFAAAAFSAAFLNILIIMTLASMYYSGIVESRHLGYAVFCAGVLQTFWLWSQLRQVSITLWPTWQIGFNADLSHFLKNFFPGIISAGIWQINLSADYLLATYYHAESMSPLFFAARINQIPLMILGASLVTALIPFLSQRKYFEHAEDMKNNLNKSLLMTLYISIPAMTLFLLFADGMIHLILERGEFTAQDTQATTLILQGFAIGIPAVLMNKILCGCFYADQNTKTPFLMGLITIVFNLVLSFFMMQWFGLKGLSYSASLASYLYAALLYGALQRVGIADTEVDALTENN